MTHAIVACYCENRIGTESAHAPAGSASRLRMSFAREHATHAWLSLEASSPHATVGNAQIDPLRREGETVAEKIRTTGVNVVRKAYEASPTSTSAWLPSTRKRRTRKARASDALKQSFSA